MNWGNIRLWASNIIIPIFGYKKYPRFSLPWNKLRNLNLRASYHLFRHVHLSKLKWVYSLQETRGSVHSDEAQLPNKILESSLNFYLKSYLQCMLIHIYISVLTYTHSSSNKFMSHNNIGEIESTFTMLSCCGFAMHVTMFILIMIAYRFVHLARCHRL